MLSPGYRTAFRALPGVVGSVKGAQSSLLSRSLGRYVHVRQSGARRLTSLIPSRTTSIEPPKPPAYVQGTIIRNLSTTRFLRKDAETWPSTPKSKDIIPPEAQDESGLEFKRTEKGEAAKEVDLSARLKDRNTQTEKGEVIRLLKLAGREWRTLSRTHPLPQPHTNPSRRSPPMYIFRSSHVNPLLNW